MRSTFSFLFRRIPDKPFGKVAWGAGITQTSVPDVKVSSPKEQHFSVPLPGAKLKTREQS